MSVFKPPLSQGPWFCQCVRYMSAEQRCSLHEVLPDGHPNRAAAGPASADPALSDVDLRTDGYAQTFGLLDVAKRYMAA